MDREPLRLTSSEQDIYVPCPTLDEALADVPKGPPTPVVQTLYEAGEAGECIYVPATVQQPKPKGNKYALCRCGSFKPAANCCRRIRP